MSRCVLLLSLLSSAAAFADDAYKVHNKEGVRLAKAGQFEQAIVEFKRAEALFKRYEHHCNIGRAYSELKKWPQAFLFLESCRLRWGPQVGGWVQTLSEAALKELRQGNFAAVELVTSTLVQVRVSAFPDDEEWNIEDRRTFWLPFGAQTIRVKDGWEQGVTIATRDARTVILAKPEPVAVVVEPAPVRVPEPPVEVKVEPAPPRVVVKRATPIAPWVVVGLGVAVTALGVGSYVHASGLSAKQVPAGMEHDALVSQTRTWANVSYVALVAGPVAIAAGVLWRLLSPETAPAVSLAPNGSTLRWTY